MQAFMRQMIIKPSWASNFNILFGLQVTVILHDLICWLFSSCVCAQTEFQCPGAQCVPAEKVCDGLRDCPSGTDEAVCPVGGKMSICSVWSCTWGLVEHVSNKITIWVVCVRKNISVEFVRVMNCVSDGSSSSFSFCGCTVTCGPDQFACRDGTCVAITTLCDGARDCPAGEDEKPANCYSFITPLPSPLTPTVPTSGHTLKKKKKKRFVILTQQS